MYIHLPKLITPYAYVVSYGDGTRYYKVEEPDEPPYHLPSITTVLKSQPKPQEIIDWEKRVGEEEAKRIMKESGDRGRFLHHYAETYLLNKDDLPLLADTTLTGYNMFLSLKPYLHEINNIRGSEQILYSKQLGLAGTADCIAEYDGVLSIIDFKNARRRRKDSMVQNYFLQCTAYAGLYEVMTGTPINQGVILMAVEDGSTQRWIFDTRQYVPQLVKILKQYNLTNGLHTDSDGRLTVYRTGGSGGGGSKLVTGITITNPGGNYVKSGGGGVALTLPPGLPGTTYEVHNNSSEPVMVYPPNEEKLELRNNQVIHVWQ